ncbi:hypothetical protein BJY24_000211 [Nocardia transvalensis]|uniref:Uncharacterized protein n=1 Tax=Nocardia transvalensis TaxID=37333 RepID=A0A7W9UFL7_9NOCA|nr:hypothetical protein [Nocardia transvalensis]MBB5911344.1 hypothetical protein [Nocardia transvalensis]
MTAVVAVIVVFVSVIALSVAAVRPGDRAASETDDGAPAPVSGGDTMDVSVWPIGWPHEAPDEPLSVSEAHLVMQRHRSCRREECPRKRAAYQTLVSEGRLKPDSGRVY